MSDSRSTERRIEDILANFMDTGLATLLEDVRRITDGVGAIHELAIQLSGPTPPADPARENYYRREAARAFRTAYDDAMAARAPHASVPTPALGMALEVLEVRRARR